MSEKRKPTIKLVAEKRGKKVRIELYPVRLWPGKFSDRGPGRYRVRMDGKWVHPGSAFTITNVMKQLRSWIAN